MLCSIAVQEAVERETNIEQYAIRAFADALEDIPLALAENSGYNAVETVTKLKSEMMQDEEKRLGVDCLWKGSEDMREQEVYESLASKTQQLLLATQVVKMILKIDDIFAPNDYE